MAKLPVCLGPKKLRTYRKSNTAQISGMQHERIRADSELKEAVTI